MERKSIRQSIELCKKLLDRTRTGEAEAYRSPKKLVPLDAAAERLIRSGCLVVVGRNHLENLIAAAEESHEP